MSQSIVEIQNVSHRYDVDRLALDRVSLSVQPGERFGFLGPNGSGKTTLFRILSTLIAPTTGHARIGGLDTLAQREDVRRAIGVVFQSPSLDKQLTAAENLRHHGHLYGLRGSELKSRTERMLGAVGLGDRMHERVGTFSGGMRRRVELAKGMLTRPRVLLLDEPSTGLDPAARIDLWNYLETIRKNDGVTILFTTHLLDEADDCDRIAILDGGKLLASDAPAALKLRIGGDVITIVVTQSDIECAREALSKELSTVVEVVDAALRIELPNGHQAVPRIIEALPPGMVRSIEMGRPSLHDVFVRLTGHRFQRERAD